MKRKIHKLSSSLKQGLFALALTVFSGTAHSQQTYTFNYTGNIQTQNLPPGNYQIECWGADGGKGYQSSQIVNGGKGGYSTGTLNLTSAQTVSIYVGGAGTDADGTTVGQICVGGFNGGGPSGANNYATTSSYRAGAGGGGTDIRVGGNTLNDRVIVAGGGGGGVYSASYPGGNGGGASGGNGGNTYNGGGGTQTAGGTANGSAGNIAGTNGALGIGGDGGTAASKSAGGGGGGGYYGGGGGATGNSSSSQGGGGGGSGYIGGVINGTTAAFSQAGFVTNPDVTGNGRVTIKSLCNITLSVTGVNNSGFMCAGSSVTLVTNAISNYSWSTSETTSSIVVSPSANTLYSLTATSPSNCTASSMITVSVSAGLPVLSLTNTANSGGICPNSTVMLTAAGAITYTWAGGSITPTNGVAFGPTALANYTVTGENGCGTTTAVTSVSVHPFPTVTPAASNSTLCAGGTLSLTATGNATNYVWSGGSAPSGNGVGFVPPPSTTIYTVIGTSALSCTAQATIPVTVHATPNQIPSANPDVICLGNSSTLTAAGALSYTWSSSTQTVYTPAFTVAPTATGVTTYTVTKSNSTCADTRTVIVTTNALPTVFGMANPAIVCALQPSSLTIGGGNSYTWTAPGPPSYTFTGANPVVYPQSSTEYTVAASDGTCISLTTVSVTANPNPTITTSSSPSICLGQQVTINANGGNSYTWTAGSNTFTGAQIVDSPTTAVAYNVTGDNTYGCTSSAQQIVLVYSLPATTAFSGKPLSCSGGSVVLTAGGADSYTWDANAGGAVSPTVVVYPNSSASGLVTYTVTGSFTTTGCEFSKTVQVSVYVPTLSVSGVTNACKGGQVSLSASGGNANTYSWNTGAGTFNLPGITTTVSGVSVFTVTANTTSLSVTCQATRTVAIGMYPTPTVTATAERNLICPKESTNLYADGAGSYLWSNSMSGGTITVYPTAPTNIYSVIGTDGNGCVSTGTVEVKLQTCTGIKEAGAVTEGLLVYPNPNTGEFTIKADAELDLVLTNELGQVIRNIYLPAGNDPTVKVSGLDKGVYFLSGQKDKVQIHQKVVVTK